MVLYFGDAVLQLRETSKQKRIVILSLAVPEKGRPWQVKWPRTIRYHTMLVQC